LDNFFFEQRIVFHSKQSSLSNIILINISNIFFV